jgi:hypothetical protein
MLFDPAALPLSRQTLAFTAGIIRGHGNLVASPWRKPNAGQQALLVLAQLRKGERSPSWPPGFHRPPHRALMRFPGGPPSPHLGGIICPGSRCEVGVWR